MRSKTHRQLMAKNILFSISCILLFAGSGLLVAMEEDKAQRKRCCSGGVVASLQRNVTTPLWVMWNRDALYRDLGKAVDANNVTEIRRLLSYGLNPNGVATAYCSRHFSRFLSNAISSRHVGALSALLDAGAKPESYEVKEAFHEQDENSSNAYELRKALINKYIAFLPDSYKSDLSLLLHFLIKENAHQDHVQCLLDAGVNINGEKDCETPLELAIKKCSRDMVVFLLERGACVTPSALYAAITVAEDISMLEMLLRRYPQVVQSMEQGLSFEQAVRIMIDQDASRIIEGIQYGSDGEFITLKPLHHGLFDTHPDMIQYLCKLGVDPNGQDCEGRTPLWGLIEATGRNRFMGARLAWPLVRGRLYALLSSGARIDIPDKNGQTIVHQFKVAGYRCELEVLLTYPRVCKAKKQQEVLKSVFIILCCFKKVCPSLLIEIKMKILDLVFERESFVGVWGKVVQSMGARATVRTVPFEAQRNLAQMRESSPGCFGSLLDKEKLIQEHTEQHMAWLQRLLLMRDNKGFTPYLYRQHDDYLLDTKNMDDFRYHWRGRVEREYRYLFDTGKLYEQP